MAGIPPMMEPWIELRQGTALFRVTRRMELVMVSPKETSGQMSASLTEMIQGLELSSALLMGWFVQMKAFLTEMKRDVVFSALVWKRAQETAGLAQMMAVGMERKTEFCLKEMAWC